MDAVEEYAKALLAEANFDWREALILLRKRLVSQAATGGSVSDAIDRALLTAIVIAQTYAEYKRQQDMNLAKLDFRKRFPEFFPNPGGSDKSKSIDPAT